MASDQGSSKTSDTTPSNGGSPAGSSGIAAATTADLGPMIGRDDHPIRAFAFAGGGFDTAFQFGVAHALLVSRGRAPDVVVGTSLGAVNAVALAEILQAGDKEPNSPPLSPQERQIARVAKFRQLFEAYQNCPADIAQALLPDTYQTDNQRPLKPLAQPIHVNDEWKGRLQALQSRAGLINLYNELLELRLTIGTVTKAVRRWFGIRAAGEVRNRFARQIVKAGECFRMFMLLGANLYRVAPVLRPLVEANLWGKPPHEAGATTAELIFRTRLRAVATRTWWHAVSFIVLMMLWVTVSAGALLLLGLASWLVLSPFFWFLIMERGYPPLHPLVLGVAAVGVVAGAAALAALFSRWNQRQMQATILSVLRTLGSQVFLLLWWGFWLSLIIAVLALIIRVVATLGLNVDLAALSRWGRFGAAAATGLVAVLLLILACARGRKLPVRFLVLLSTATVAVLGIFLLMARAVAEITITLLRTYGRSLYEALRPDIPDLTGSLAMAVAILGVPTAGVIVLLFLQRRRIPLNLLGQYDLADGLFDPHPLRQLFVRLFDPNYYGGVDLDAAVDRALRDSDAPADQQPGEKLLGHYATRTGGTPIHVALSVADVSDGSLRSLAGNVRVVDALLAATAVTPLFPPFPLKDKLYVDASNVANEPTRSLIDYIRPLANPAASVVHLYSVVSLPISKPELGPEAVAPSPSPNGTSGSLNGGCGPPLPSPPAVPPAVPAAAAHSQPDPVTAPAAKATARGGTARAYTNLVDVALRALQLQRFRDVTLEHRITELYTRAMPPQGKAVFLARGLRFMRTWVYPVEPDEALNVNERLAQTSSNDERRLLIAETVADGCRAALERMAGPALRDLRPTGYLACSEAIERHLSRHDIRRAGRPDLPVIDRDFPGRGYGADDGPGLVEVCRNCAIHRGNKPSERKRTLKVPEIREVCPEWPDEYVDIGPGDTRITTEDSDYHKQTDTYLTQTQVNWPVQRPAGPGSQRPTVNLLFSGGVFRGVFQVGVLGALDQLGVKPDIVAGASVGSITAAMFARVFQVQNDGRERAGRIARLAATFLAIDRLILTDRFADSIRAITVRAAGTRFSLRDADRVMRRYDEALPGIYEAEARDVVAGIERLFYVSPFELKELIAALRAERPNEVYALLREDVQEYLRRLGVGNQVLGAEPLELLINEHVLKGLPDYAPGRPGHVPFNVFLKNGMYFLATATNLTQGRLEILGAQQQRQDDKYSATLLNGLLASSAFPGVFRPRWSWELMPATGDDDQYIDGGVMDNLPLDAVTEFLYQASKAGLVTRRPTVPDGGVPASVPHLLLTASLEPNTVVLEGNALDSLRMNWPSLFRRARQLGYNKKVEIYTNAQRAIRTIVKEQGLRSAGHWEPLDLEVITIKPRWLCGTFAFHPMLGFRRSQQAASIAHGCASTVLELGRVGAASQGNAWLRAWGVDTRLLPTPEQSTGPEPFTPLPVGKDECWFRRGQICPYSRTGLEKVELPDGTRDRLNGIYTACGRIETHAVPNGKH